MVMDTNDKLRKRVAELESDVASIGGALQYAERKIRQMEVDENRDDCRMALNKARRVVEHERKLAAAQDVWDRIGEIRTECARYGPALQEASECLRIRAKRVAELEAENERLREQLNSVRCGWPSARMRMRFLEASLKAITQINKHMQATWGRERCWAAAWKRAASKFRAWQADTDAELELERRAVDVLARRCEQWSPPVGFCDHGTPLHVTCAACWARWARKQARAEAGDAR